MNEETLDKIEEKMLKGMKTRNPCRELALFEALFDPEYETVVRRQAELAEEREKEEEK